MIIILSVSVRFPPSPPIILKSWIRGRISVYNLRHDRFIHFRVLHRTRRQYYRRAERGFAEDVQKIQFLRLHVTNRRVRRSNGKLHTVSAAQVLIDPDHLSAIPPPQVAISERDTMMS